MRRPRPRAAIHVKRLTPLQASYSPYIIPFRPLANRPNSTHPIQTEWTRIVDSRVHTAPAPGGSDEAGAVKGSCCQRSKATQHREGHQRLTTFVGQTLRNLDANMECFTVSQFGRRKEAAVIPSQRLSCLLPLLRGYKRTDRKRPRTSRP